ncbi:GGDEF domain-containing protein [Kineococcus terrestris]|uniref:GGDEF domain-containing protein n=1 Tax=Kineococcus terrestris TaxID=2044856 RepID=UPI0034DADF16
MRRTTATALRALRWTVLLGLALAAGRLTALEGHGFALVSPAAGVAALWCARTRTGAGRGHRAPPGRRAASGAVLRAAAFAVPLTVVSLPVHLLTGADVPAAALLTAALLGQTLLLVALLGRWAPRLVAGAPLDRVRHLVALVAATALAAAAAGAAALGAAASADALPGGWSWTSLAVWTARAVVGVLLVVPLGLRLQQRGLPRRPPRAGELAALAATGVLLHGWLFTHLQDLPVAFLLLPLTVWAALRFSTSVLSVHNLLAGAAAVVLTLEGVGPFAGPFPGVFPAAPDEVAAAVLPALLVQAFVGVSAVVGLVLALVRDERDALLARVRAQAAGALRQAEHAVALTAALRSLNAAEDVRAAICAAAREVTGADGAYLLEPDGSGALSSAAVAGAGFPPVSVRLEEESVTTAVFRGGDPLFVADLAAHDGASPRLREGLGVTSAAFQPVRTSLGERAGVLVCVWRARVDALPAHVPIALATLASEAAHAVERADLLLRLALAAERDPLTGLANRRRWDESVASETARAARSGLPLSFVLLDLDHFKRYNDTLGHLAGDDLLREFATAAAGCLREVDTLARWGGEEFVLALPGCSAAGARAVADRIRAVVPRGQTCTAGVAQWRPGQTAAEVLALCDLALYEGKERGRDVTVVADEPAPVPAPVTT